MGIEDVESVPVDALAPGLFPEDDTDDCRAESVNGGFKSLEERNESGAPKLYP